jgi:uncharacterized protein YndB with AHSA1/START domain
MADVGISITRVFDAPRERVWREWTTSEAFADWYGGAAVRIPLSSVAMDVRVGGGWRATMVFEGQEIHWKGEYLEVDEPRRLVFTVTDRPDADARELVTVELVDLGDGRTKMHFEQRGGMTPEQYERAGKGWGGFFDRMDERLAAA